MARTQDEIERQVQGLSEMKGRTRQYDGFGNDTHEEIDAQISVLNGADMDSFDDFGGNVPAEAFRASTWLKYPATPDLFII